MFWADMMRYAPHFVVRAVFTSILILRPLGWYPPPFPHLGDIYLMCHSREFRLHKQLPMLLDWYAYATSFESVLDLVTPELLLPLESSTREKWHLSIQNKNGEMGVGNHPRGPDQYGCKNCPERQKWGCISHQISTKNIATNHFWYRRSSEEGLSMVLRNVRASLPTPQPKPSGPWKTVKQPFDNDCDGGPSFRKLNSEFVSKMEELKMDLLAWLNSPRN